MLFRCRSIKSANLRYFFELYVKILLKSPFLFLVIIYVVQFQPVTKCNILLVLKLFLLSCRQLVFHIHQ